MARQFKSDDDGKRVVTADGDRVGKISRIDGKKAFVEPTDGLGTSMRTKLGWSTEGEDEYELMHDHVQSIDDEIQLKKNL